MDGVGWDGIYIIMSVMTRQFHLNHGSHHRCLHLYSWLCLWGFHCHPNICLKEEERYICYMLIYSKKEMNSLGGGVFKVSHFIR